MARIGLKTRSVSIWSAEGGRRPSGGFSLAEATGHNDSVVCDYSARGAGGLSDRGDQPRVSEKNRTVRASAGSSLGHRGLGSAERGGRRASRSGKQPGAVGRRAGARGGAPRRLVDDAYVAGGEADETRD